MSPATTRARRVFPLLAALLWCAPVPVHATEEEIAPQPSPAVDAMLKKMRENDVLSQEEYEDIYRRQAQFEYEEAARAEIPRWLQDWTFGGDFRVRFDRRDYGDLEYGDVYTPGRDNIDTLNLIGVGEDNRFRFRLRLGAEKQMDHGLGFGFRLVTSSDSEWGGLFNYGGTSFGFAFDSDPRSANVDAGGLFSPKNVFFDRMYLRWDPKWVPAARLWLGKMPNPFTSRDLPYDNLVFDPEIQPEGLAAQYRFDLAPERAWLDFAGGAFLVRQTSSVTITPAPGDPDGWVATDPRRDDSRSWLYGVQGGIHGRVDPDVQLGARVSFYSLDDISAQLAAALLDLGNGGDAIDDNPLFVLLGPNSSYYQSGRSDGRMNEIVVDAYAHLTPWGERFRVTPFVQWMTLPTASDENMGLAVGVEIGTPDLLQLTVMWARIERNATIAIFTDSELFDGYTNAEGWYVALERRILPRVLLRTAFMESDQVNDECEAADGGRPLALCDTASQIEAFSQYRKTTLDRTRIQVDLTVEF